MREIKFSIILQHQETGRFLEKKYTYSEIFNGKAKQEIDELNIEDWFVIAKRLYVGLHDKNGKEVFDGDICRVVNVHDGDEYIWNNIKQEGIPFQIKWDDKYKCFEFGGTMLYQPYNFEVIGNIYENPELLTNHK